MLRSNPRMSFASIFFNYFFSYHPSSEGKTAADIAAENGNSQMAQFLQVVGGVAAGGDA
jgi:hypothetical protein